MNPKNASSARKTSPPTFGVKEGARSKTEVAPNTATFIYGMRAAERQGLPRGRVRAGSRNGWRGRVA